jgi:hypothetical protein
MPTVIKNVALTFWELSALVGGNQNLRDFTLFRVDPKRPSVLPFDPLRQTELLAGIGVKSMESLFD